MEIQENLIKQIKEYETEIENKIGDYMKEKYVSEEP
jgi:hypothetical protein